MPAPIDLTGHKYNKLTVIREAERGKCGVRRWHCKCDCGNETTVFGSGLRSGATKSCGKGCIPRQNSDRILDASGKMVRPPGYWSWKSMQSRCHTESDPSYADYGGRGIKICERWLGAGGLRRFLDDMGPKPSEFHSVGRLDPDKDYCPENCRWQDDLEQGVGKRNTRLLYCNGEKHTISGWERRLGLADGTIHFRLRRGWTVEEALSTPRCTGGVRRAQSKIEPGGVIQKRILFPEDQLTG